MMNRVAKSLVENSLTIVLIVIGVVFVLAARTLPAPRFDPLGAGAFPTVLGWLMVALGLLELGKSVWIVRRDGPEAGWTRPNFRQGLTTCIVLLLTVMYGLAMAVLEIRFAVATVIYLVAASFVLQPTGLRRTILLTGLFILFAFALQYLLKSVAYVDFH